MNGAQPPRLFEWLLLRVLPARDRETISGDLFEDYCEERLPRLGRLRAGFWYARQVMGFALIRLLWGSEMKSLLILMSLFTIAAGAWLAVMENVLKHEGYPGRTMIDLLIAAQGVATLSAILFRAGSPLRILVILGAVALACVGISAVSNVLRASHFEGYVLVIGSALVIQGILTITAFVRPRLIG